MKKLFLLLSCVFLLCGCGSKIEEEVQNNVDSFVLSKVDESKDYVYSIKLGSYLLPDQSTTDLEKIVINLNSEDASNVNMELNSFVKKADKSHNEESMLLDGYVYHYDYSVNESYLSLVIDYQVITRGVLGECNSLVYVLSMKDGTIVHNEDLLKSYHLSTDDLYLKVKDSKELEDGLYSLRSMKDNGYYLYIDSNNHLTVLFYEETDDESIKRELVLN